MATYEYNKIVNVRQLAEEIFIGLGYQVIANSEDDSVNGWIEHYSDGSLKIHFYDTDELPNDEHDTTLVATILTEEEITQLNNIVANHIPE